MIKKAIIILIFVLLIGAWYLFSNRTAVSIDHKSYTKEKIFEAFQAVDFKVMLPKYVPEAYEMQSAIVYHIDGNASLAINDQENNSKAFE